MDEIQKLRDARAKAIADAKAITDAAAADDGRDLTEEEASKVDALLDEADKLKADIETAEAADQRRMRLVAHQDQLGAPADPARRAPANTALSDTLRISAPDQPWMRSSAGALRAFTTLPASMPVDEPKSWQGAMPTAQDRYEAYRAGMFVAATCYGADWARDWCRKNDVPIGAVMEEGALSGQTLVPTEMASRVIVLRDRFGVARRECLIEPMASDTKTVPKQTGFVTVYAVGEAAEITASDQAHGQVLLTAKKWGALLRYSSELDEDSIVSLGDRVAFDMGVGFADKEDDCLFNGDGTSTYHGIHGIRPKIIDGNHTTGAVDAASGIDTFAEVTQADLEGLLAVVREYALNGGNLKWYGSQRAWAESFAPLIQAAGGLTAVDVTGGFARSYLGFPFVSTPKMPTGSGDQSNVAMIVLGDLRMGSILGDRRGFRNAVLRERYAELDQIGIVATSRFDINVHGLGDTSEAGPIVALIGE